ncbi:MAG TPA: ATP-binding protein [Longimicrobiales bacterium]|nr:ATP-binding protein [Longimicrobiales bacterium]
MLVGPLRLLRWIYASRLILAAAVFVAALFNWVEADPQSTLVATLVLLVAVAVTGFSAWWTGILNRSPGANFLYGQSLVDSLLVTGVVHVTGGYASDFAPLYILVIAAGALMLPLPGGMLIGALTSLLYFADILWGHEGAVPSSVFVQVTVFAVIALVTGYLGDRLRRTGVALGEVVSELRQLRLDHGDILAALDTGVVTVDADGRLVYMNDAAAGLLGIRRADWLGRPVLDEMDARVPALGSTLARSLRTRQSVRWFESPRQHEEGEERLIGARTTVLERAGAPWATVVVQDITDGRRLEEVKRRAERLQAVAELSASMAHEIKNPLASIRSAVEQLTAGRKTGALRVEDRRVLGGLVLTESDRLSRLLTDFIEFGRVEPRQAARVDLAAISSVAIELAKRHPESRGDLSVDLSLGAQPIVVQGDEDLLHRAIYNLVLNALQHSKQGPVRVDLRRVREWELPVGVEMEYPIRWTVSDDGGGIAPADLSRVFDPFFTRRRGGSGLGLALVHRAVTSHHGAIFVDTAPAGGTRFTVYLPGPNGES